MHLVRMKTTTHPETTLSAFVPLSQLASQFGVSIQTLYDMRSQRRGAPGFRVGRQLRFRVSEVDSWSRRWRPTTPSGTHVGPADAHQPPPHPGRYTRRDQYPTTTLFRLRDL